MYKHVSGKSKKCLSIGNYGILSGCRLSWIGNISPQNIHRFCIQNHTCIGMPDVTAKYDIGPQNQFE